MSSDILSQSSESNKKSKLLLDSNEIVIFQSALAVMVGDREAMALQKIHYWCEIHEKSGHKDHFTDDQWWVYNTWQQWLDNNFPFWSLNTIRRIFSSLGQKGLIITRPHSNQKKGFWVTVNYGQIETALKENKLTLRVRRIKPSLSCGNQQDSNSYPAQNGQGKQGATLPILGRVNVQNGQATGDPIAYTKPTKITKTNKRDSASTKKVDASAPQDDVDELVALQQKTPEQAAQKHQQDRKQNPWYDAVYSIWKYVGGRNGDMQKMLQGKASKKQFKPHNLEVAITPDQLLQWAEDYKDEKLNGGEDMNMLERPDAIKSEIETWLVKQVSGNDDSNPVATSHNSQSVPTGHTTSVDKPSMRKIATARGFNPDALNDQQLNSVIRAYDQGMERGEISENE